MGQRLPSGLVVDINRNIDSPSLPPPKSGGKPRKIKTAHPGGMQTPGAKKARRKKNM